MGSTPIGHPNMSKKEKLLIVSCSTGSGHFRAAESIRLTCQNLYPNTEVLHIDMADYLDEIARIYVVWLYDFFSVRIPSSYKFTYYKTDKEFIQKLFKLLAPIIRLGSKKFLERINDYQPDAIISTHFLPQLIFPKNFSTPTSVVITDYHAHRIWLAPKIKNFFVATEEMKNNLSRLYFGAKSRILDSDESESGEKLYGLGEKTTVSGIPIHPNFFKEKNISKLKTRLNIENDWPIILVMPTSWGEIDIKEAITAIFSYNKNINVVAVSGKNNKRGWNDLKAVKDSGQKNFTILKNTPNIDEWMRIADIIISKAGGLTISEAMYLQKPLLIINPIPGQEEYNTAYLEKNHYCLRANSGDDLAKKIKILLANPNLIQKKSHPNASEIILKKILSS